MLLEGSPDVSLVKLDLPNTASHTSYTASNHDVFDKTYLASSMDFFTPISQDPYMQGRIAAANTLSDLYAIGADRIDTMLMVLGVCLKIPDSIREIITKRMIQGFNDTCSEAECAVTGGQTIFNPWPIIGGSATTVITESRLVRSDNGEAGDVLVLTKPLGTQLTGNLAIWMMSEEKWSKVVACGLNADACARAITLGEVSMSSLNRNAARLMKKHKANGATDITGFGLLGHSENLVGVQNKKVDFIFDKLPIIKDMEKLSCGTVSIDYKLLQGQSAETSGGLLIMLPTDHADCFLDELKLSYPSGSLQRNWGWKIGKVVTGNGEARICTNFQIIEV